MSEERLLLLCFYTTIIGLKSPVYQLIRDRENARTMRFSVDAPGKIKKRMVWKVDEKLHEEITKLILKRL